VEVVLLDFNMATTVIIDLQNTFQATGSGRLMYPDKEVEITIIGQCGTDGIVKARETDMPEPMTMPSTRTTTPPHPMKKTLADSSRASLDVCWKIVMST